MDLGLPGSPRFLTDEFNRRLVQQARQDSRLVLDVNALASLVGHSAWSAGRYWYAAKYPFATGMIPLYADNVMRIHRGADGTIAPRAGSGSRQHDVGRHRRR